MVKYLERKSFEEWLRLLGLSSLEKRTPRRDFIVVFDILMRGNGGAGNS